MKELLAASETLPALYCAVAIVACLVAGLLVALAVGLIAGKRAPKEEPHAEESAAEEEPAVEEVVAEEEVAAAEAPLRTEEGEEASDPAGEVIAVADMSPSLRAALGVVGAEYDGKWYSVKYSYGFDARIALSGPEVRTFYTELIDEIAAYRGLKRAESWRQQRIYTGRKKLGAILFKGKKLCLALALDPAKYADTKYRGKDVSAMRRFAETPMLFPIGTPRKLKYAKFLLGELAAENGLVRGEAVKQHRVLPEKTRDELLDEKLIKALGRETSAPAQK